jgi:gas vesicle protein
VGIIYVVIGYLVGLLVAPRSGKESRKKIKDYMSSSVNKMKDR